MARCLRLCFMRYENDRIVKSWSMYSLACERCVRCVYSVCVCVCVMQMMAHHRFGHRAYARRGGILQARIICCTFAVRYVYYHVSCALFVFVCNVTVSKCISHACCCCSRMGHLTKPNTGDHFKWTETFFFLCCELLLLLLLVRLLLPILQCTIHIHLLWAYAWLTPMRANNEDKNGFWVGNSGRTKIFSYIN